MLILLGACLLFFAIFALVLGLTAEKPHPMTARIASLRGERMDFDFSNPDEASFKARLMGPLAASLGAGLQKALPAHWVTGVSHKLLMAGQPATTTGFLAGSAFCIAAMSGFGFLMVASGSLTPPLSFIIPGFAVLLGLIMPKVWLDNRVAHRQKTILKSLPDAFDLITTCVEAGLGLEAAMAKVAEKVEGPFGEELNIMLREVSMGKLRRDALREVSERTGVPDLTAFINAVIQAETMGTSIAAVLRVQAEQMRMKRRQRAEQQAQAAPIKMMFPLVLFIFPTLFIVILGPAVINIYEQFMTRGE
jgi:tight adherence protein C